MSQFSKPSTRPKRPVAAASKWPAELPAELTQARRFGKARSAQSTALMEDYVELIADLLASAGEARPTDIARRLGMTAPALYWYFRSKQDILVAFLEHTVADLIQFVRSLVHAGRRAAGDW